MAMEVTGFRIILMFVSAGALCTLIGFAMQMRSFEEKIDKPRDCKICTPQLDKKIPMMVAFLNLLAARELPVFGLCSSCKVSFDGSNLRRAGNFCVVWKEDYSVTNIMELLAPQVNLTCTCNSILTGKITPPKELFNKFPCLNTLPSAVTAIKLSRDLSLEALEICQAIPVSTNNTSEFEKPEAKITIAIKDFRLRVEARLIDKQQVTNLLVRLSHMSPQNIQIYCDLDPRFGQLCSCLNTDSIRKMMFYFIETMIPCMVTDTVRYQGYAMLRDFLFCFPDKKVKLFKAPHSPF